MYINLENTQSNILFIGTYTWLKSIKKPERKTTKFMAGTGLSRPGDQIGCIYTTNFCFFYIFIHLFSFLFMLPLTYYIHFKIKIKMKKTNKKCYFSSGNILFVAFQLKKKIAKGPII